MNRPDDTNDFFVFLSKIANHKGLQMEDFTCYWSPKLIVELIKSISWPLVVLIIGLKFRNRINNVMHYFFSKSTISEISATATGVSAKFVATKQSVESLENPVSNTGNLPLNLSVDAIKQIHNDNKTKFSEELYQLITEQVSSLDISTEDKIELLSRELSIHQSYIRYFTINKVLFRSQYNLFSYMAENEDYINKEDVYNHFHSSKEKAPSEFTGWDFIKYIAYPVSSKILQEDSKGYRLTSFGKSYIVFMSKNPQLIDELTKI
ncbi:hypothetical protein KFO32_17145 [Pantoea ananatis]|uniref:hypothetical protein n=1 Tax=Pantoea ananas TaxID=553 RepID=UPI001FF51A32|nr:hypothetical protein [Pantoea ananatis]MCK0554769.1 hypothetical protein [Pantoea ananatis]